MASELLAAGFSRMLKTDVVTRDEYERRKSQGIPDHELPRKLTINDLFDYTYVSGRVGPAVESPTGEVVVTGLTGKRVVIPVNEKTTVMDLKMAVFNELKVSPDQQKLMYNDKPLDDETSTLSDAEVPLFCQIYMIILHPKSRTGFPFYFHESMLAPRWDYDFTGRSDAGHTFKRGGHVYERPCGWRRYAVNVLGKYSNDVWLGSSNGPGEWPVSYHGASLSDAENIAESGCDLSKKIHSFPHKRGIYTTPSPVIAEKFSTEFTHNGQTYKIMLQNRQNPAPDRMAAIPAAGGAKSDYWVAAEISDLRPYAVCVKRV